MRCRIELQKLQATFVEIEVPDDADGDQIYDAALKKVETRSDVGNPNIEYYEEICEDLPSA
jgi:hypothetical protein